MLKGYVKSHKLPAVAIRLNNVTGPHRYPEKVVPKFISLLQHKMPLLLHGDGQHSRRYLYAGDAAEAFDTILHRGEIGQIYNVDSRDEVSSLALAEKLLAHYGLADEKSTWIKHTDDRKFNDRRYAVNGSKLRKLGWEQRTRFGDALAATVDWYARFEGWWGDIEGVLAAHPRLNREEKDVSQGVGPGGGNERDVKAGAVEEPVKGFQGLDGVENCGLAKKRASGNRTAKAGVKKRKADTMSEE